MVTEGGEVMYVIRQTLAIEWYRFRDWVMAGTSSTMSSVGSRKGQSPNQ